MEQGAPTGFTLLETLVALVVLGFLMTGLVQGLRLGVAAWRMETRTLADQGDTDTVDRTLRALIARIDPGGFSPQKPTFVGTATRLACITSLTEAAGAPRQAEVTLTVNEDHEMQLLWLPHYRNRINQPPPPERVTLRQNVDHLEMAYWSAAKTGWQPEWAERALPRLIRIRVVPTRDGGRLGPDIVIAPMRERWRQ